MNDPTLRPAAHDRPTDRRQILALAGGGFRGLYTALILESLEAKAGRPLRETFDVIAGTSIGGIIAAAIALGIDAVTVRQAIADHGRNIFDRRLRIGNLRLPVSNVLRHLYTAKHPAAPLRAAIESIFGDAATQPLSAIDTPLLITAVNATTGQHQLFHSAGLGGQREASHVTLLDALMASAAAPTYFPAHAIDTKNYVDGGLIANAPDLVALTETLRLLGVALDDVRVLSVGTAGASHAIAGGVKTGIVAWLARGLVQLTLSAQESLAVTQCGVLLRERFLRIDAAPTAPQAAELGLDRATDAAKLLLARLAAQSMEQILSTHRGRLRRYLAHHPLGPKEQVVPMIDDERTDGFTT